MTDPAPLVTRVIAALREHPQDCWVEHIEAYRRHPHSDDIWIAPAGVWMSPCGAEIYGVAGNPYLRPGFFDRWRLRRAVRDWRARA